VLKCPGQFPGLFGSLAARCNSLRVSGRPGLILATEIASESEVRWTGKCTYSFHLTPSSCRISCFLYIRAFLASINQFCASEFGLHWRNMIVVVVFRRTSKRERERERERARDNDWKYSGARGSTSSTLVRSKQMCFKCRLQEEMLFESVLLAAVAVFVTWLRSIQVNW